MRRNEGYTDISPLRTYYAELVRSRPPRIQGLENCMEEPMDPDRASGRGRMAPKRWRRRLLSFCVKPLEEG